MIKPGSNSSSSPLEMLLQTLRSCRSWDVPEVQIQSLQIHDRDVEGRGEYMSKKNWNCLPWNSGYFETVCPGQPENLQNCLSKHKVNIFRAMLKNIINSKKLPVLYFLWSKMQKGFNTYFLHLFGPKLSITSKNFWNCLWVCLGSETVCPEKDK